MPSSSTFRTFQTVQYYESALSRHSQWVRWTSGITCPCLNSDTFQPDTRCTLCAGRGRIYKTPGRFQVLNEIARHDSSGKVYPSMAPLVVDSAIVYRQGTILTMAASQPSSGAYAQLDPTYPQQWEKITMDYRYDPDISITDEDSEVYGTNILRTVATQFSEKGKDFEGSVKSVSRVYNSTKDETYTVNSAIKEYIYLSAMGTWESGDVLEVDYIYQKPFNFLLIGITPRMRYEQPYVLETADAILITPYWAQVAPDDMLTALAVEQIGRVVIDPVVTAGTTDEILSYYDLSRLLRVIDTAGVEYTVGPSKNVEIFERNFLQWNITKPVVKYTAQFTYNPTFTALNALHTLRNSENKAFVNRISVKQFDRVSDRIEY